MLPKSEGCKKRKEKKEKSSVMGEKNHPFGTLSFIAGICFYACRFMFSFDNLFYFNKHFWIK